MRRILIICATFLPLIATPAIAEEAYRAGYEIIVNVGKGSWRVQTRSPLSETKPIRHDFGEYEVSISLRMASESEYSVTVRVQESGGLGAELLEHAFDGAFNGVLEFSAENELAAVTGAIAVSPIG